MLTRHIITLALSTATLAAASCASSPKQPAYASADSGDILDTDDYLDSRAAEEAGLLAALAESDTTTVLEDRRLGDSVDDALLGLRSDAVDVAPLDARQSAVDGDTLGIGSLDSEFGRQEKYFYANPYARDDRPRASMARLSREMRRAVYSVFERLTSRVSDCYGQPMLDNRGGDDRLAVALEINNRGRVLGMRVLEHTKIGAPDA